MDGERLVRGTEGGGTHVPRTSRGVIWLTLFLDLVGFGLIFPVFAELVAFYTGRDQGLIAACMQQLQQWVPEASEGQRETLFGGILFSLFTIMQFGFAPIWGALSDRFGRRPVLLWTIAGNALAYGCWAFAGNFWLLLITRLLAGCMSGNLSVATAAMADASPPERRTASMGLVGVAFATGFLIGPTLGGLTYSLLPGPDPIDTSWWQLNPFSNVAFLAMGLSLVNLAWASWRLRETLPPSVRASRPKRHPLRVFDPRLGPGIIRINVATMMFMILFTGMETCLVFTVKDHLGFTPRDIGFLFIWLGGWSALVQGGVVRRLSQRVRDRDLAMAGFLVQMPGYGLLAVLPEAPSLAILLSGTALLTAGVGLAMPSMTAMVSKRVGADRQGTALGQFRSAGSLGRAVGPLIAGTIYFLFGPSWPYGIGALGVLLPMMILFGLRAWQAPPEVST